MRALVCQVYCCCLLVLHVLSRQQAVHPAFRIEGGWVDTRALTRVANRSKHDASPACWGAGCHNAATSSSGTTWRLPRWVLARCTSPTPRGCKGGHTATGLGACRLCYYMLHTHVCWLAPLSLSLYLSLFCPPSLSLVHKPSRQPCSIKRGLCTFLPRPKMPHLRSLIALALCIHISVLSWDLETPCPCRSSFNTASSRETTS